VHDITVERRSGIDRRRITLSAFIYGARNPRRRIGRRSTDRYPVVDWHSPRVLALVIAILGFCAMDAVLTVVLISHGAREINPVMALFVPHNLFGFAAAKLLLTALGVSVLVACSRMRVFRGVPGEAFLYATLAAYALLIGYELHLLERAPTLDFEHTFTSAGY
jgi:hypothetical protein